MIESHGPMYREKEKNEKLNHEVHAGKSRFWVPYPPVANLIYTYHWLPWSKLVTSKRA